MKKCTALKWGGVVFKQKNATCVVDPMLGAVMFGRGITVEAFATFRRYVVVGNNAIIGEAASIGPGAVIGNEAVIGHHACLNAGVLIKNKKKIKPFACVSMDKNYNLIIKSPGRGNRCYWDATKNKCVPKPW